MRERFHHLGIAKRLVRMAVAHVKAMEPDIRAVTVNSSPYAVGFYEKVGFQPLGPEKKSRWHTFYVDEIDILGRLKMKKKWITNVILVLLALVFVGSGLYLFRYFWEARQTENELGDLQQSKLESAKEGGEEVQTSDGRTILKDYRKLYKKNSDLIGWVTVKDTKIDYPVMQTPKDSEYYLHRNFKKKKDVNGLPFWMPIVMWKIVTAI